MCLVATVSALNKQVENKSVEADNQNNKEIKKIAITFDDGPHPQYTDKLLDGLKQRGVKATFFVTGEHAQLHNDIIKRMNDEGHLIGNHTYTHMQLDNNNIEQYQKELMLTNELLERITGKEITYVRPPYGVWDKQLEQQLNMIPVLWTLDTLDWCTDNSPEIVQKVVKNVKEDDIILMHDYYETSVDAALVIVDELLSQGYTFVTIEDMLFD